MPPISRTASGSTAVLEYRPTETLPLLGAGCRVLRVSADAAAPHGRQNGGKRLVFHRGEIVSANGQSHPGKHPPIVDQPLWDAVQGQLASNTAERASGARARRPSFLTGMLFDSDREPE